MAPVKAPDIAAKRLPKADYVANFTDLHPPLDHHEALVESDRCYFCHDAPCMQACPTSIDIPMFIREIQTGHPKSAAKTIFDQNILGGMCARVCPTETLCEEILRMWVTTPFAGGRHTARVDKITAIERKHFK